LTLKPALDPKPWIRSFRAQGSSLTWTNQWPSTATAA